MAEARTFACPSCGASITRRALEHAAAVACAHCGSVLDARHPNLRILSQYKSRIIEPRIPLGTRGTFLATAFEAVGFLRRKVTVEGVDYAWSEYLLFNPFKGFRWLTEYQGHWVLLRTADPAPKAAWGDDAARHDGRTYKHFQSARAEVTYVAGEFTWAVKVGESAMVRDFVCPPHVLSGELTGNETVWSEGEYLQPEEVWKAFALPGSPPVRQGAGACQPNPVGDWGMRWKAFGLMAGAALLLHVFFLLFCSDRTVLQTAQAVEAASPEKAWVSEPFEVQGRTSNLHLKSAADVDNNWAYLSFALLDLDRGTSREFGRELSYYHGYDGGESWSEGSPRDSVFLGSVPSGKYALRVEPEFQKPVLGYRVEVRRDVPRWSFFWWTLVLLALPLGVQGIRWTAFENRRWQESDHPWSTEGDDDE